MILTSFENIIIFDLLGDILVFLAISGYFNVSSGPDDLCGLTLMPLTWRIG